MKYFAKLKRERKLRMQIQVGFEDTVVNSLVKNVCDVNAKNLIQYLKFIRLPILSFY